MKLKPAYIVLLTCIIMLAIHTWMDATKIEKLQNKLIETQEKLIEEQEEKIDFYEEPVGVE